MKFTNEQISMIQGSWGDLKKLGMQEVGLRIFQRLFNDAPFIRSLFYDLELPDEEQLSLDQMRENPKMKSHATRVATSISHLVKNITNSDELNAKLEELGKIHGAQNVEPEYFEYLAPVMLAVIGEQLGLCSNSPILQAWVKFYGVIRNGIIKGM